MEYDPFIKTGAQALFYAALLVLLILWVVKKRKQLHFIKDQEIAELKEQEKQVENEAPDKPNL